MSLIISAVVSFLVSLSTCFVFFLIIKKKKTEEKQEKTAQPAAPLQNSEPEEKEADHSEPINDFTFDNFYADDPTFVKKMKTILDDYSATNPVILRGPTGSVKTHLMRAFENYILEKDPSKKIRFVSAETFTNEFIAALKQNKIDRFRFKYRNLDALFIDDLNYLKGKLSTQQEMFYSISEVISKKAFVCFAFTTPGSLKDGYGVRMKGIQIDMPYPGFETKRRIIMQTFEKAGCFMNGDLVDYLAKPEVGLNELVGICQKIILMKDLEGKGCVNLKIDDIKSLIN